MKKKIVAVVGPTASGKSRLAVRLAQRFGGEILSADSMQLYRGMDIGTAKPDESERGGIPHHLIDILDIRETFSVSDYCDRCRISADELFLRGALPILCGGTGLYVDSFLSGIRFGDFAGLPAFRAEMQRIVDEQGIEPLYRRLCEIDPQNTVDGKNPKRVIRALEVYEASGKTMTEWNRLSKAEVRPYDSLIIGLAFFDRQTLYEQIDKRVDDMMARGLLDEVERLLSLGLRHTPTAGQAIGYKEFYPYFEGVSTLEDCVETLKRKTRRYAKRQITWFKRNPAIHWLLRDGGADVYDAACTLVREFLEKDNVE